MSERVWSGTIAIEDVTSVDGRLIEPDALTWPKGPVPLIGDDWTLVGRVDWIGRDGDVVMASGVWFGRPAPGRNLNIQLRDVGDVRGGVFKQGLISAVYVTTGAPAWPECQLLR